MSRRPHPVLELDPQVVRTARRLAKKAGAPVVKLARTHTTVSVERALLRQTDAIVFESAFARAAFIAGIA